MGPATAINSDYPLLESYGIVKVKTSPISGRASLLLVKRDVVKESLPLLEAALGEDTSETTANQSFGSLWLPSSFRGPEDDRRNLHAPSGAEAELFDITLTRLREGVQKVTRGEWR